MTLVPPRRRRRFSFAGWMFYLALDRGRHSLVGQLVDRGAHVKSRLTKASFLAIMLSLLAILGLDAASFAYFSATGSNAGSTAVGFLTTSLATTTGTPSTLLMPGASGDLVFSVTTDLKGTITSVTQSGPVTVSGSPGCTSDSGAEPAIHAGNSGVSVPSQTLDIPISPGTQVVHVPGGVTMAITSASACQGATFSIPITITVTA